MGSSIIKIAFRTHCQYSEQAQPEVSAAIQATLLNIGTTLLPIACHPRYIHPIGTLTEVICLDAAALSVLIKSIPHLGTPEDLVASAACRCEFFLCFDGRLGAGLRGPY